MSPPTVPFQFDCPICQTLLQATASDHGRPVTCPICGQSFPIPHYDTHNGRVTFDAERPPKKPVESMAHLHAYASNGRAAPELVHHPDGRVTICCRRCGGHNASSADTCDYCRNPFAVESGPQRPPSWIGRGFLYLVGIVVVLSLLSCLSVI